MFICASFFMKRVIIASARSSSALARRLSRLYLAWEVTRLRTRIIFSRLRKSALEADARDWLFLGDHERSIR